MKIILKDKLLSTSADFFIMIWSPQGQILCKLDVNEPLPIQWDLKIQKYDNVFESVDFAIKTLNKII